MIVILSGEKYLSDEIGIVGKKGELYPPKKIRVALNLQPKNKVRFLTTPNGNLLVMKIPTIEEILKKPSIAKISIDEAETISEQNQFVGEGHSEDNSS